MSEKIKLWRKAADAGNIEALVLLGDGYLFGSDGFRKDRFQGLDLLTKASELGHAGAQRNLAASCSQDGDEEGYKMWIRRSAKQGVIVWNCVVFDVCVCVSGSRFRCITYKM